MEVLRSGNGSIRSGGGGVEVSDLGNGSIKIRRMEMLIRNLGKEIKGKTAAQK